jgi:hypothetical protein
MNECGAFKLAKVGVVHSQLPCVTFMVNGLRPELADEFSRIAASGCVYEYATEVFDVAAV